MQAAVGFDPIKSGPAGSAGYTGDNVQSHEVRQVDSQVSGTGTVSLSSGGDTSLRGATVTGDRIVASIGGDLTIESRFDTARYRESSVQAQARFGGGSVSGGASRGSVRVDSANVAEQSGLIAGAGGYQLTVGGGVNLIGGLITATADPSQNRLSADHLIFSDLVDSTRAMSSSMGFSLGAGGLPLPQVGMPVQQSSSGVARATLSPGVLELRNQGQDLSGLNRDASAANRQAQPYDIERLQARQRSVAALSELMNEGVGTLSKSLGLEDGSPVKAALHAAAGALTALAAGGNVAGGALAGAASELVGTVVNKALADNPNLTPAERNALGQWAAVLVGAVTAGEAGAAISLDAERYNRQLHQPERDRLKELAGGDENKETRLKAAACALAHCADGVSPDDPNYAALKAMQDQGAQDQASLDLLRHQTEDRTINYCTKTGCGEATLKSPLFDYSDLDRLADYCTSGTTCTRVAGGAMMLAGGAGVAAALSSGLGTCVQTAGGSCAAALVAATTSLDVAAAGTVQASTGRLTTPMGEQVLQSFGLSPIAAALIYGGLNAAAQFGADAALLGRAGSAAADVAPTTTAEAPHDVRAVLQEVTDRAVSELNANPALARELMSPGSYQQLVEGTNLAAASYGKAVERLTAR